MTTSTDSALRPAPMGLSRLWRGHGLWRFPNFVKSVRIDTPQWGFRTASKLHYRRLTMERGAKQLPPVPVKAGAKAIPVYFMSGNEHWAMTAFCAYSLLTASQVPLMPVVLDDGSLDDERRYQLHRILPNVRFLDSSEHASRVHNVLKRERFPALHKMRSELPLMKKLMDLHAGYKGWKLFLDSDMLFFREPEWMIDWLKNPMGPAYMCDFQNSYGYPRAEIERVLGTTMPEMTNTGVCGLRSDAIDWDLLERWASQLWASGGTNHFSEQCLVAMWMAVSNATAAPRDYLIWPSAEESQKPSAVMHHYVAESRTWYHIYGWPQILRQTQ